MISREGEAPIVEEFFQLFKTPWEYFTPEHSYDVVISTRNEDTEWNARLVLVYTSETGALDSAKGLLAGSRYKNQTLVWNDVEFPIYGNTLTFEGEFKPVIRIKGRSEIAGIEMAGKGTQVVRIGFNLFEEISFLLTTGQPVEFANIPTVEIQISILRKLILDAGISFVEIPPFPIGYRFMVCLTHDVDFMSIRDHKFDRSAFGFIWRIFFPYSLRDFRSKISWSKLFRNVKALLSLPGAYLGLLADFWFQLDRYLEIEKDVPSTFFFIPFKGRPGDIDTGGNIPPKYRSCKYDINKFRAKIRGLAEKGKEIGLHGLDAWHNAEKGSIELQVIRQITGEHDLGVRMHWLYFSENSPRILEEAGFCYDSTLGYNDAAGHRSGTAQAFRLPGASGILELPLHVQDTAIFYKKRMGLSEAEALKICEKLITDVRTHGGVFTINWHQRSLGPERNWDGFYIELLQKLKSENALFVTGRQAVNWFEKRRAAHFDPINSLDNGVRLKLSPTNNGASPRLLIRLYHPRTHLPKNEENVECNGSFRDIPWADEREIEISF